MMLEVSGLHVGYGGAAVLQGLDLAVREGECVALLGRNGMGKTTLVRAMSGLTPPQVTAGSVRLAGKDVTKAARHEIARTGLGLVPQGRRVFGSLTVEENLTVVARKNGEAPGERWTVPRIYEFFPRLADRQRSLGRTLSGGEQQMLAIGRALMTNPRLLVMDEPSEGLAQIVLDVIRDRLLELRRSGLSVLVAEQNVDLAVALADRVVILGEGGTLVWEGTAQQVEATPDVLHQHLGL